MAFNELKFFYEKMFLFKIFLLFLNFFSLKNARLKIFFLTFTMKHHTIYEKLTDAPTNVVGGTSS